MRVLFLTPAYPPFHGGGERYVGALAHALTAVGLQITVLTSTAVREADFWAGAGPSPTPVCDENGVQVMRLPLRPLVGGRAGLGAWRKAMVLVGQAGGVAQPLLLHLMRRIPPVRGLTAALAPLRGQIDLIHGFNISWEYPLVAGWQMAQQWGIPFVATPFAHLGLAHGDRVALNSTMPHQLAALRGAAAVLPLTAVEAQGLAHYGLAANRLHPIGGGADSQPPELWDEPTLRQQIALPPRYAIFVGRASYDKGAIHAAQAILHLRQQGQAVSLVLVGHSTAEFDQFYGRLTPAEQAAVRPLGPLDEVAKHSLLRHSDLLLLPSQADSFGIVLLEAWAHGKPIVAARAGGIPGVVQDGRDGVLVPFGDVPTLAQTILRLWDDAPLRHQLGQHGRARLATEYQWSAVAQRVLQAYQNCGATVRSV